MKYLGIDFGAKKIGLALSDGGGMIAFPHSVITNDTEAVKTIVSLIAPQHIEGIVAGDTRTESGTPNEITQDFSAFIEKLEQASGMKVELVREHGTTGAARGGLAEGEPRGEIASPRRSALDTNLDARAAALILQRFLDGTPKA